MSRPKIKAAGIAKRIPTEMAFVKVIARIRISPASSYLKAVTAVSAVLLGPERSIPTTIISLPNSDLPFDSLRVSPNS